MRHPKQKNFGSRILSFCIIHIFLFFNFQPYLFPIQQNPNTTTQNPNQNQEASSLNPCAKNVMIYFDASHSMIEKVGGEAIMQFMLRFMKEAAGNQELLKNGDFVLLKKFAEKSYPFNEIGGEFSVDDAARNQTTTRISDALYQYERIKIRGEHNDYINLLEDIRQQILNLPPRGKVMNTVVIFSDFLYDPPFGQDALQRHKADLEQKLFDYRDFFDSYQYKLVLIYKKNPKIVDKGIDVFDAFSRMRFAKSIISPENIAQLIEDLKREIIQPVRAVEESSRFLYKNGILNLLLTMENPNCEEIRASSIEIESIKDAANDAVTLASRTVAPEGSKTFKPLSSNRIEIPLNDTPPFEKLIKNGYPQKNYRVDFLAHTQWGPAGSSIVIPLREDDFVETFAVEIEDLIFIDHVFTRYDKLFIKLKIDGFLFDNAALTIRPELEGCTFVPVEPLSPLRISATDRLEQMSPFYVYKVGQNSGFRLKQIKQGANHLKLNWDIVHDNKTIDLNFQGVTNSDETAEKTVEPSHLKNYGLTEIIIFALLILAGFGIRIFFHLKRGKQIHASDNP
jgi:hypothetical protein